MLGLRAMKKSANSVRIISGHLRRRKFSFPANEAIRPTGDRVRETLFNWLQNEVLNSSCLDLFAGSGVLGLEALSRGASKVFFVERDRGIAKALEENLGLLNLPQGIVCHSNALDWIATAKAMPPFNIVFLDPPFTEELLASSCAALEESKLLAKGCCVYMESSITISKIQIPKNWIRAKEKKAGNVYFYLFIRRD